MKRTVTTLVLALTILLSGSLLANNTEKMKNANLLVGIKSENAGLRKSSIYMAGLYKVKEAAELLREELKTEEDAGTRILIALALYKIDDRQGMEEVKDAVLTEQDENAKRMFAAIYNEYMLSKGTLTAGLK